MPLLDVVQQQRIRQIQEKSCHLLQLNPSRQVGAVLLQDGATLAGSEHTIEWRYAILPAGFVAFTASASAW